MKDEDLKKILAHCDKLDTDVKNIKATLKLMQDRLGIASADFIVTQDGSGILLINNKYYVIDVSKKQTLLDKLFKHSKTAKDKCYFVDSRRKDNTRYFSYLPYEDIEGEYYDDIFNLYKRVVDIYYVADHDSFKPPVISTSGKPAPTFSDGTPRYTGVLCVINVNGIKYEYPLLDQDKIIPNIEKHYKTAKQGHAYNVDWCRNEAIFNNDGQSVLGYYSKDIVGLWSQFKDK